MTRRQRRRTLERRRLAASAGISIGAALVAPAASQAADHVVTSLGDPTDTGKVTLRDAINAANLDSGATPRRILFGSSLSGAIDLGSTLPAIAKSVQIVGPGAGTIDVHGNGADQILRIDLSPPHDPVSISGLTFSHGGTTSTKLRGGGIYNKNSVLTLTGDAFSGNSATYGGGLDTHDTTTISGSTFDHNTAGTYFDTTKTTTVGGVGR